MLPITSAAFCAAWAVMRNGQRQDSEETNRRIAQGMKVLDGL